MWWARWEREHGKPGERSDPDKAWYPQRQVDYKAMELEAAEARYAERHKDLQYHDGTFPTDLSKWAKERSDTHPYRYDAGVVIFVADTDLEPHNHFLGGEEVCDQCSTCKSEAAGPH